MEKCKYGKSDLTRYLQNKMTRKEETEFQKHVLECADCAKELECMRNAVKELEQEDHSKKKWIIAVAIACSVGGGVYFSPIGQVDKTKSFEFNQPDPYNSIDSIEKEDTLFLDTIQGQENTYPIIKSSK